MLLENLKQRVSTLELEPAGGGVFEVFVDGDLIYSKEQTGEFPEPQSVLDQVMEMAT